MSRLGDLYIKYDNCNHEHQIKQIWDAINKLRCQLADCCEGGNGGGCIPTVNGHHGCEINLTTTDIPEGSNLYYTDIRVQNFSDPRYAFKVHTHTLSQIIDFPLQTGHGGEVLYTNGTNPYWGTVPSENRYTSIYDGTTTATASSADTIRFRTGNNLLDIVVGSNDPTYGDNVQYTVNQSNLSTFIKSAIKAVEVRFKVGHIGAPINEGDTTFTLKDCSNNTLTDRVIKIFIEGYRKYYEDDFVYNPVTGLVTLTTPPVYGQRFIIEVYPIGIWDECNLTTTTVGDFPYDFPFDF